MVSLIGQVGAEAQISAACLDDGHVVEARGKTEDAPAKIPTAKREKDSTSARRANACRGGRGEAAGSKVEDGNAAQVGVQDDSQLKIGVEEVAGGMLVDHRCAMFDQQLAQRQVLVDDRKVESDLAIVRLPKVGRI